MSATGERGLVSSGPPGSRGAGGHKSVPGRRPAGGQEGMPAGLGPAMAAARVVRAAVSAPFTARSRRGLVFCLAGLPFLLPVPLIIFIAAAALAWHLTPGNPPNPAWEDLLAAGIVAVGVTALMVPSGAARAIGGLWRALAARLLGEQVAAPPAPARHGQARWPVVGLRDGPSWRAVAYLMVKVPVALLGGYAVFFWVGGLVNLSFPLWWLSFRNHAPGTQLSPVAVRTPFDPVGLGHFSVATFAGTFAAAATGAAMLLAAPWVTRAAVSADRWLIAGLLGPGRLAQRVHDLEQSRALAVDDSAARLRRLERDLHDGAQVRLATLAMNLGMAKEKLGDDGQVPDASAARELVNAALRDAREAIGELRHLARGIHPAVLDNGLADALETLVAGSAVPAELEVRIPVRPTQAIETIAYFCAAELLANAVKHSGANTITIQAAGDADTLRLSVSDDGAGGADPQRGTGLAGLRQRVAVVDGSLDIASPPGGPTRVTVGLPLRA